MPEPDEDQVCCDDFPWNLNLKYWQCKLSLKLFGDMPFKDLYFDSLRDILKDSIKCLPDNLPDHVDPKNQYDKDELASATQDLIDVIPKTLGHEHGNVRGLCRSPRPGWPARLGSRSDKVSGLGILLPHPGIGDGDLEKVDLFFRGPHWDEIKGLTFKDLFCYSGRELGISTEGMARIRLGKRIGVLRVYVQDPFTSVFIFAGTNDKRCKSCDTPSMGCETDPNEYCQTSNGECTAASDCPD